MDYTKIYRTDVTALLEPGDQAFAIVPYRLAHGAERVERTPEVVERRLRPLPRRLRRRVSGLQAGEPPPGDRSMLDRVIDYDLPWNQIDWDKTISGTSVAGGPGSWAVRLADATRQGSQLFGVVTARRFAIVRRVATDRFEPVAEVPRADVVYARRHGRPFQRGRVVIAFADGSYIAVENGIFLTGQARRLVAALSPEHPGGVR